VGRATLGLRRSRQSGYTLLELLLVMLIVAGLTAVTWPRLVRASRSLTVRAAARDLVALAARARLEALSQREPVEMRIAAAGVSIVRGEPRLFDAGASVQGDQQEEVTVLEYPLSQALAIVRLQVLNAEVDFTPGGSKTSPTGGVRDTDGPAPERVSGDELAVTFHPDGTSDDALIGLGESGSDREDPEYYVRVRGLVGRATVGRTLGKRDEELFAEVQDAARDW